MVSILRDYTQSLGKHNVYENDEPLTEILMIWGPFF